MSDMSLTLDLTDAESMTSRGGFVDQEGRAHCLIQNVEINAMRGDKMVKGFMFEVCVNAFVGKNGKPDESQLNRTFKLYFGNPDATHKDGGEFFRLKQTSALIAANVIEPADLGKKGIEINLEKAHNQQILVEFAFGKPDANNKVYLDLKGADIYHLDDPRAAAFPRNAEILEFAADGRRSAEFFAPLMRRTPGASKPKPRVSDEDLAGL